MVDTYDLFRRLSSGARYKSRPSDELKRVLRDEDSGKRDAKSIAAALDFFGDSSEKAGAPQESTPLPQSLLEGAVSTRKRKRNRRLVQHSSESAASSDEEELQEVEAGEVKGQGSGEGVQLLSGQSPVESGRGRRRRKKRRKMDSDTVAILKRQEANAFRNSHRIYVSGADIPDAVGSFEELASSCCLPSYVVRNVQSVGYTEPTPIQMQTIPLMLHGREVLACAPTGSGKTAAFIIPILTQLKRPGRAGFRAVVVAPTRELAQQTHRELLRLGAGSGLKVHVLTKAKANANTFGLQSSQKFDVLVTTPNRLVHMLSQQPPAIQLHNVEWLVLDEADKLFEEGTLGFRDQVIQIYQSCDNSSVKHALFSATMASGVEEFSRAYFDNPVRVIIGLPNSATDLVKQELLFVGQESGKLLAVRDLMHKGFSPPVLIFVQSIERAKDLFHELIYDSMNVDVIHSERTQAQREGVVKGFRAGKIWILICTDLMGRGMDFKGVDLVINYDFPSSAVSYIHRIGRTGRAGRSGRAVTFFTEEDSVNLRRNTRKKLARRPVAREEIKTASKYDLQRWQKRREMVAASVRRKKQEE